jgi:hypothetical protein
MCTFLKFNEKLTKAYLKFITLKTNKNFSTFSILLTEFNYKNLF